MKYITRILLLMAFAFNLCSQMQAKSHNDHNVYAFAFGTSFNDSTVFLSSVTQLNGGDINRKTKFLENRAKYAQQFKKFLDAKYSLPHTCAVFYGKKRDAVEKQYAKLRNRYRKNKEVKVVEIPVNTFNFTAILPEVE